MNQKEITVKVTMMLADHAASENGRLYVSGGGWTVTGPPAPFGIALLLEVPWDQLGDRLDFRLELVDSDGEPFVVPGEGGVDVPLIIDGELATGRPPGMKRGTPAPFPLAINSGPLPLQPDMRYEWRLTVNGESQDDWRLAFSTRPF